MFIIKTLFKTWVIFVVASLAIGVGCSHLGCSHGEKSSKPDLAYVPLITEISPQTTEREFPWIELYNPLEQAIKVQDFSLVINDTFQYALPKKVPTVPPKAFIVLKFDGRGNKADNYKFRNGVLELHLPAGLNHALKPQAGQIAVYKSKELVGFVSWGKPGSKASLTLERHKIWRSGWFVPTHSGFGLYLPDSKLPQQFIIGLPPGSRGLTPDDWAIYPVAQGTPGKPNAVALAIEFTLTDGAVVRSEDITVGWTGTKYAKNYEFQLAKDTDFSQIVEQRILSGNLFKPESPLPEGDYYYRVRIIDSAGQIGSWSKTMKLISKKMVFQPQSRGLGTIQEKELTSMVYKRQRKDSHLLCLDGCPSHLDGTTVKHWDNIHPDAVPAGADHGSMNCVRASTSMMVSFYGNGKILSQDRIAYYDEEENPTYAHGDLGIPEHDLAHRVGVYYDEVEVIIEWALNEEVTVLGTDVDPTFAEVQGWIDNDQPLMTVAASHMRVLNGYRIDDANEEWVHIMDPWSGPRWETYDTWANGNWGVWVGPLSAPDAREDEPEIAADTDSDSVMDFDEQVRFNTGRLDLDSDNDGVNEKEDIYEYVYQFVDVYSKRDADFDADGVRKENDPDNDADSFSDGCEDKNGNGIYEPGSGETDNFAVDADLVCDTKPIHAIIVFDRSGSMALPYGDTKYDRAADAATLFLDAWLANDPPAETKVGLVFYDHNSYYDTHGPANTTLGLLNTDKKDKIVVSFPVNLPDYGSTSIGGGILRAMDSLGFNIAVLPADDQHRVVVVLTDGKENTGIRMDDPAVTQALVDGKVDGYVLGIGDESQIDEDKLNTLADILNHPPASLAKDLDDFELEKFFLQVLAETQGMEFSVDPVEQIAIDQTKTHEVPVNPGAERVTFVVVWNETNGKIDFTLKNPEGQAVAANVIKTYKRYQISTKVLPEPGQWTLTLTASSTSTPAPPEIHYSIMALEKNTSVSGHFAVQGVNFLSGSHIRLTATLSQKQQALTGGRVVVKVDRPTTGLGTFTSKTQVRIPDTLQIVEKDVKFSPLEQKFRVMAQKKLKMPTMSESIILNDEGDMGDEIPGDGTYTGIFKQTQYDGIYTFRFLASVRQNNKFSVLNREKVFTVNIKPRIQPKISSLNVIEREYRAADNQTFLKLTVTPKDHYGNLVGPGHEDLLKLDIKQGQVVKILDKLDGTYELQMIIPGDYKKKPALYRPFSH